MARSAALVAWVAHFLHCNRCGVHRFDLDADLRGDSFTRREPLPRARMCAAGVALLDAWLDEPEAPGRKQ